jgi:BNR repeat domain protein
LLIKNGNTMKRLTKGFLSFIMMTSYALGMSAQDATFVPADEIPSSLRDAASLKLTGTWGTSAFAELKMALGTNAIGGSNMVLTRVDMGEAVIEDGTSWYVSAGFTSNGVFSSCKALKEVVMPVAEEAAHLVSMEKAFANCNALETVDLTGCVNVSTFSNAFYACESLKGADLSTNVAAVKSNAWASAFEACTALAQVKLPAGFVTTSKVFSGCVALQEIDWSACTATEVPVFYADMLDGVELSGVTLKLNHPQYVLFKADEGWSQLNLLDLNPEPSTEFTVDASDIPSSLKKATAVTLTGTWDSNAFNLLCMAMMDNPAFVTSENTVLQKVDMSAARIAEGTSLRWQGLSAYGIFRNFKALKEVKMPVAEEAAHFTDFGMAFQNCDQLVTIDLSGCAGLVSLEKAFQGCTSLEKVDLSSSSHLESVDDAFESCEALTTVILPEVFPMGKNTFAYCSALKDVDWTAFAGTEVPEMSKTFFMGIDDLKAVTLSLKYEAYKLFSADEDWSELNLYNTEPEKVTDFVVDASDIPSSLKKAVTVTLTGEWDSDAFNLLSMALGNNGGLFVTTNATLVTLDMSRIKVAENTPLWRQGLKEYGIFNNCTALEKVIMPTAEEAGHFTKLNKAFEGCTALRDIDLSLLTGATDIEAAFKGTAIEKADLSCCTSLGSTVSAFEGCVALQEVILPSCFVPANYTFADCTGLKLIDYTAYTDTQDAPAVKNNTFSGIDDLKSVTLKVNGLNHNLFETHKIWSEFDVQYDADGIQSVVAPTETLEVYAIDGRYIGTYKSTEDWSSRVPYAGIYIVNGKKVLKK